MELWGSRESHGVRQTLLLTSQETLGRQLPALGSFLLCKVGETLMDLRAPAG